MPDSLLTVVLQLRKKKTAHNTHSLPSPENSFTILITHYHQVFTVFRYRATNGAGNQFLISNLILKLNYCRYLTAFFILYYAYTETDFCLESQLLRLHRIIE